MKILIYGLNFSPELTGIGKYTGEMADWLAAQGHEVRVVTAPPYYPAWQVGSGYRAWAYRRESFGSGSEAYSVWRCPLWVPRRLSGVKRLIHLVSFAMSSFPVVVLQALWRPDVVWGVAPALMCAPGAWLTACLARASAVMHIQDYEVDAAFQLGLLKHNYMRHFALWAERALLRRFDVVSTISGRMADLAKTKGVDSSKVVLFRNWVDLKSIVPPSFGKGISPGSAYREELKVPDDAIVALYSGNMGMKQGLEVLPEIARLLSVSHPHVFFVFCGQGAGKKILESQCEGLSNVRILPLQPVERLGELLTMADIHLLPQRADAADLVMPSKLTGMLASARPVVATALPGTELGSVVEKCGILVPPENTYALAQAVIQLAESPESRQSLGGAGRAYAEQYLNKDAVLRNFESMLISLVSKRKKQEVKDEQRPA